MPSSQAENSTNLPLLSWDSCMFCDITFLKARYGKRSDLKTHNSWLFRGHTTMCHCLTTGKPTFSCRLQSDCCFFGAAVGAFVCVCMCVCLDNWKKVNTLMKQRKYSLGAGRLTAVLRGIAPWGSEVTSGFRLASIRPNRTKVPVRAKLRPRHHPLDKHINPLQGIFFRPIRSCNDFKHQFVLQIALSIWAPANKRRDPSFTLCGNWIFKRGIFLYFCQTLAWWKAKRSREQEKDNTCLSICSSTLIICIDNCHALNWMESMLLCFEY